VTIDWQNPAAWRLYARMAKSQAEAASTQAVEEEQRNPALCAHLRMLSRDLARVAEDADNAAQACEQGVQGVN